MLLWCVSARSLARTALPQSFRLARLSNLLQGHGLKPHVSHTYNQFRFLAEIDRYLRMLTPLFPILTKTLTHNSFIPRTYRKKGEGVVSRRPLLAVRGLFRGPHQSRLFPFSIFEFSIFSFPTPRAKSEWLRPQTKLPKLRTPRQLQTHSRAHRPADSTENLPPHSPRPMFRTPSHAVRVARFPPLPNLPTLPRFRYTNRPAQRFRPAATASVWRCKAATLSLPPIRIRRPAPLFGAAHGRSAIRSDKPNRRKKRCAPCTKSLPNSPPGPFHIARRAFLSRTKSAAYAKNLPRQKSRRLPEICETSSARRVIPAAEISSPSLRLAVRVPAARNMPQRPFPATESKRIPCDRSDSSSAEATARSAAPGSPPACPLTVPARTPGHTLRREHLPPSTLFAPAIARPVPATRRNARSKHETHA